MTLRILVTGGAGLLGWQILKQAPPMVTVAATTFQRPLSTEFTGKSYQLDLSKTDAVARLLVSKRYEVVINCAGASDVDRCEADHEYALQSNEAIVRNLVEGARKYRFLLISFSSDYVFDGLQGLYSESDRPNPVSYYGQTKLMAERVVVAGDFDSCMIRICSLYSTDLTAPKNIYRNIAESITGGATYRAADDLFSNPTEVADLARAIWQLVAMPKLPRVLHLASPNHISRYDLAMLIAKKLGVDTKLIERVKLADLGLPAQRPRHAGLKSELALSLLGRELKSFA